MRCHVPTLLLCASALLACDPSDGSASDPAAPDGQAAGKADGASDVEVVETDEPLFSPFLQERLCTAIADAHAWGNSADRNAFRDDCHDHAFTVTQTASSTLYNHADDSDAVTMQMLVEVQAGSQSWDTRLVRVLDGFRMVWEARVDGGPPPDPDDAYIREFADEVGEYLFPGSFPDKVQQMGSFDDLPLFVEDTAYDRVDESNAQSSEEEGGGYAELADEDPYEILRDGEVVGFVVEIWYYIDDPLFDGGGLRLYLNWDGDIIEETEWWG